MHFSAHRMLATQFQLPSQLHILIQTRLASTTVNPGASSFGGETSSSGSSQPYPYPKHPRPSPHQIFHLSPGASQTEVKARYYELVRAHHPDSHHTHHLPHSVRHSRFQAISNAYEVLRRGYLRNGSDPASYDTYSYELEKRRRAYYASYNYNRHAEYQRPRGGAWSGADAETKGMKDEPPPTKEQLRRERAILLFGFLALMGGLYPSLFFGPLYVEERHRAAVTNLSQARRQARELGQERREKVREYVKNLPPQPSPESGRRLPAESAKGEHMLPSAPAGVVVPSNRSNLPPSELDQRSVPPSVQPET